MSCEEVERPAEQWLFGGKRDGENQKERKLKHGENEDVPKGEREKLGDCMWVRMIVRGRELGFVVHKKEAGREAEWSLVDVWQAVREYGALRKGRVAFCAGKSGRARKSKRKRAIKRARIERKEIELPGVWQSRRREEVVCGRVSCTAFRLKLDSLF